MSAVEIEDVWVGFSEVSQPTLLRPRHAPFIGHSLVLGACALLAAVLLSVMGQSVQMLRTSASNHSAWRPSQMALTGGYRALYTAPALRPAGRPGSGMRERLTSVTDSRARERRISPRMLTAPYSLP